jgi:hypothetical protein
LSAAARISVAVVDLFITFLVSLHKLVNLTFVASLRTGCSIHRASFLSLDESTANSMSIGPLSQGVPVGY